MKVRVDVTLKHGVLDPQGKAISHALDTLGFKGVGEVRVGKTVELNLNETDVEKATALARTMAEKLLANMVIEDFNVSILS
jgi:phosphoribosylformylglycinamidine synthase